MRSILNHKESYPSKILPRSGYKKKLNIKTLLSSYPELLIVRQVDGYKNDYILQTEDGKESLNPEIFQNNMANLSFNLAGGLFDTDSNAHLRFLPSKDVAKSWYGENILQNLFRYEESYRIVEPCFGLCFLVKDLHDTTFPFRRHFENPGAWSAYIQQTNIAVTKKLISSDAVLVEAFDSIAKNALTRNQLKVNHRPSVANYWHVTLDTYPPNQENYFSSEDHKNSQDRRMFEALKQHLKQFYMIDVKPNYKIARKYYIRAPYIIRFFSVQFLKVWLIIKSICAHK